MKHISYRVLWVCEVVSIVIFAFVLTVPVQDYAMREFKEWYRNPSPDTLKAFRLKQEEESHLRLVTAAPFRYCSTAAGLPVVPTPPEAERVKMIHRPDLRDSEFGVILSAEQIDVRHVLLADPPFAPTPGARVPLQTRSNI